ncbi:retrovirus-related pol polyprotein from transposon TNT 1-94 [Tanacetum coccineum]
MQKNLALPAKYFKRLYKPTNNNLRTSSNSRNKTEDTTLRYNNDNQSGQFGNQRTMTVVGTRETVGSPVVQQTGIQCFNYKGFGHYAKDYRRPKQENKTILKQLKKANASLTQELEECKTNLDETSRALGEATSCRDSCLIALQNKQNELEKYIAFNDRTIDYEILQTKLNDTLGLLALKDIEIKEGLKTKAYEILVLNQKHDELVKKSLLTKSQLEGYLKEKTKVISDLKVKEEKDIDKMIEMDKQLKFLNEIVYTRNQSIQTIHMLAPKCSTYNGRPTFGRIQEYVKSLEKEVDELESEKADFSNKYDLLLIVQLILFIVDSGCTKHMTGNLKLLCNFVEKFLGTVHFGNDQFAPILGYGDLIQGNVTIKRKSTMFVERIFRENDLLTGNRGSDLYTISLQETTSSTPICFMAKASPTQAWLWHRRLSHLNFDYITLLSKKDVVTGLPKLTYAKINCCSYCENDNSKKKPHLSQKVCSKFRKGRLRFASLGLWGPMRFQGINGKKYILNGIVERRNHTLVEAARMMLSASKLPLYYHLAEALQPHANNSELDQSCYRLMDSTAYHIINDRNLAIKHSLHLCLHFVYITREEENLERIKEKGSMCPNADHGLMPDTRKSTSRGISVLW